MEAIRSYLETMFLNLPNTQEVYKAKNELWQMMEDKYTELKAEGKSENEAVGTVISEFGNLDELAKDLGIDRVIHEHPLPNGKPLPLEDAKKYLKDYAKHALLTALGVLLCIVAVTGPILFSAIGEYSSRGYLFNILGGCSLFVIIAIAVGLLIYSGVSVSQWNHLKTERYVTDFSTTEYLHQAHEAYKPTYALLLTIGVVLCIISLVPSIVLDGLYSYNSFWDNVSGAFLFILVGLGVFLIVLGSMKLGSINYLLRLNQQGTVGGSYTTSQQNVPHYSSKTTQAIMSVYWPTVTCLYLIWSFLSFDWWITWIIWPIASIIHSLIKNLLSDQGGNQ
ncbi:MAG: permease prefix domain 1-containing protein [Muribaculaceae bacterium]|nr:permease prefix domain 1-containing protein [Roseburia sp.]MCM1431601.1 permease prefix domain 1-containing protein [Muribaculaceae bacterium]MCM1492066.1 permease prefix domain 1-containing protein [Muribaculaceae bacterium]